MVIVIGRRGEDGCLVWGRLLVWRGWGTACCLFSVIRFLSENVVASGYDGGVLVCGCRDLGWDACVVSVRLEVAYLYKKNITSPRSYEHSHDFDEWSG